MRRADRLFMLVEKLRSGRLVTAQALADGLEVSERTIYRDIAHLIGAGVPIEGAAGLGYMMRAGYDLPPLMFSEEEIVALTAGLRIVQSFGGKTMGKGADSALDKISAVLPKDLQDRVDHVAIHAVPSGPLDPATREAIDTFEAATEANRRVHFSYRDEMGAGSDRTVRPLGLWFWGRVWTLVAWCELRQDFRMFRLDRIRDPELLDVYQSLPGQGLEDFYAAELARRKRGEC